MMGGDGSGRPRDALREERRRDARVAANGSVLVHGRSVIHARLVDLSSGGACVDVGDDVDALAIADDVAVALHLDRDESSWLAFDGHVLRVGGSRVAIAFTAVPIAFADLMPGVIAAAIEGASLTHVLLVDADVERRAALGALMRHAGCRVAETSTPLDAIAHLGGSSVSTWLVAIADTRPPRLADELRGFLAREYPRLDVVSLGARSPTVAVMRLLPP